MYAFQVWKESIEMAEVLQREEEIKLRQTTEHGQSTYTHENMLRTGEGTMSRRHDKQID
jgi:hypothetical protein